MSALSTFPKAIGDQLYAAEVEQARKNGVGVYTYGEPLTAGNAVYLKASDGKIYKTNATALGEAAYAFIGWVLQTGTAADTGAVSYNYTGDQSGLTVGSRYYLSGSSGGVGTAVATAVVFTGIAISTTEIKRDYELRQTEGTISDNNSVATSTGGGTNTDTTVTHNLGVIPKQIRIYARVVAGGGTNSRRAIGEMVFNSAGTAVGGHALTVNNISSLSGSAADVDGNVASLTVTGVGGVHDTVSISLQSIGATSFVFRITAQNTTNTTPISQVTSIKWIAIG